MSAPSREVALYEASEQFWNKESSQVRESILCAAGYELAEAFDFKRVEFKSLNEWAQKAVVRLIGEKLSD